MWRRNEAAARRVESLCAVAAAAAAVAAERSKQVELPAPAQPLPPPPPHSIKAAAKQEQQASEPVRRSNVSATKQQGGASCERAPTKAARSQARIHFSSSRRKSKRKRKNKGSTARAHQLTYSLCGYCLHARRSSRPSLPPLSPHPPSPASVSTPLSCSNMTKRKSQASSNKKGTKEGGRNAKQARVEGAQDAAAASSAASSEAAAASPAAAAASSSSPSRFPSTAVVNRARLSSVRANNTLKLIDAMESGSPVPERVQAVCKLLEAGTKGGECLLNMSMRADEDDVSVARTLQICARFADQSAHTNSLLVSGSALLGQLAALLLLVAVPVVGMPS